MGIESLTPKERKELLRQHLYELSMKVRLYFILLSGILVNQVFPDLTITKGGKINPHFEPIGYMQVIGAALIAVLLFSYLERERKDEKGKVKNDTKRIYMRMARGAFLMGYFWLGILSKFHVG